MSWPIVWLAAAATDRRHIVRYISRRASDPGVAITFMDGLMQKIGTLSRDTVLFRPGRIHGTREYAVHPNYIVVYRVNERLQRVEIVRLWTVWKQPGAPF